MKPLVSPAASTDSLTGRSNAGPPLLSGVEGVRALQPILDGILQHMADNSDFGEDGIFCEWYYWIDWSNLELTVGCAFEVKTTCDELSVEWMEAAEYLPGTSRFHKAYTAHQMGWS